MEKSSGLGLPTYPPSHRGIILDSGLSGFRFPYGCGAAGALNPLPLPIRLFMHIKRAEIVPRVNRQEEKIESQSFLVHQVQASL